MFKLCSLFMILSAINQALLGDTLSIGAPAPQVSGLDNSGEMVDLGTVMQSGTTLLFLGHDTRLHSTSLQPA